MIHLLLCFPGTCPTLPLFSPPLAIPLVHSENRSISHSCCLDFPGEKEKIIWECIHTRLNTHQSILHTKFHKSYGIRIQLLLLWINIIISLNFPLPFYIFHKSAHSFSTTFKSLCSLLFHGLEPITDSSLPFKNWHY